MMLHFILNKLHLVTSQHKPPMVQATVEHTNKDEVTNVVSLTEYALVLSVHFAGGKQAYVIVRENLTRNQAHELAAQMTGNDLMQLLPKRLPGKVRRVDLKVINLSNVRPMPAR